MSNKQNLPKKRELEILIQEFWTEGSSHSFENLLIPLYNVIYRECKNFFKQTRKSNICIKEKEKIEDYSSYAFEKMIEELKFDKIGGEIKRRKDAKILTRQKLSEMASNYTPVQVVKYIKKKAWAYFKNQKKKDKFLEYKRFNRSFYGIFKEIADESEIDILKIADISFVTQKKLDNPVSKYLENDLGDLISVAQLKKLKIIFEKDKKQAVLELIRQIFEADSTLTGVSTKVIKEVFTDKEFYACSQCIPDEIKGEDGSILSRIDSNSIKRDFENEYDLVEMNIFTDDVVDETLNFLEMVSSSHKKVEFLMAYLVQLCLIEPEMMISAGFDSKNIKKIRNLKSDAPTRKKNRNMNEEISEIPVKSTAISEILKIRKNTAFNRVKGFDKLLKAWLEKCCDHEDSICKANYIYCFMFEAIKKFDWDFVSNL